MQEKKCCLSLLFLHTIQRIYHGMFHLNISSSVPPAIARRKYSKNMNLTAISIISPVMRPKILKFYVLFFCSLVYFRNFFCYLTQDDITIHYYYRFSIFSVFSVCICILHVLISSLLPVVSVFLFFPVAAKVIVISSAISLWCGSC